MRITGQDLASSSRPASPVQPNILRQRRWPPLAIMAVMSGLLVLAFALGVWARTQTWLMPLAAAENPRFQIASTLQQSQLPTLYLDVEFQDAQKLEADRQNVQATGVHIARPGEAVTATVRLGNDNIRVQIQLPAGQYNSDAWAFEITTQDKKGVVGWHHLMLYDAARHHALSQWGLSESLRREGILSASVQPVQVILNGDAQGVYGAWAAPDEMAAQNRLSSGLVYFDQTLYWQDLRRQRGSGPAPTSISLSDCQAAIVAAWGAADKAAISRLRDLQTGARKPSDVLDVEQMGTLLALSSLWQGTPLDDWTRLMFYRDPSTDRLRPAAAANLISASDSNLLNWPLCFDDPLLQAAYIRAVERISQPEYLSQLRASLGNYEQMQLAFSAREGKPELTWDDLAARQKGMARWLEPTQMVLAGWVLPPTASLKPTSVLSVSVANLQRVPVEVLGFDVGKSTFLPIDPAWIQNGADLVVSSTQGSVILRAADVGRLHALRLNVPYTSVFAAGRAYDEQVEMRVVTRLWGLERRHSGPMQPVSGE
jgi:hypothetical protein